MKGRITKTGYRRNSPDVNNDFNIIPSNRISMRGVDFPVFGVDNMGNSQMMYPGGEYEFQGDYVTELPAYGSGGLTQWFAEKWVDIKTGKECGRSGKDKKGRPYPACRPSKRVNSTTPKTSSEMSASEKAKFKRKKKSGKRIDYNHKRAQLGIEVPKRNGVRKNPDGSVSTHLMATETLDGKNWFSFPTLFQDPDGAWVDMSDRPWEEAYKEAKKRGEVIEFGTDKEAAIKFGAGSWKKQFGGRSGDVFQEVDTYIKPGQNIRPNWAQTPDAVTNYTFGKNLVDDESRFSLGLQGVDILDEIQYRADALGSIGVGVGNRNGKAFRPAGENLRAGIRGQASWQGVPGNVIENMFGRRSGLDWRGSVEGEAGLAYANGAVRPYLSFMPQTNIGIGGNMSIGIGAEMRGRYDNKGSLTQKDAYSGMSRGSGRYSLKYDMGDGDFIEGYYAPSDPLFQGETLGVRNVFALESKQPRFGIRLRKSFQPGGENDTPLTSDEIFNIPRTVRYENGKMVIQDKPIYDGMLDEVTVTPPSFDDWMENFRANRATGGLKPVYPIFEVFSAGIKTPATLGVKSLQKGIKNAPAKINPRYFKPAEDLWYRQVGKSAIDDIAESRVIRERGEDILNSQRVYNDRVLRMKGIDPDTGKPFANWETAAGQKLLGSRRPKSPYFQKGELYWGWNRKPGKGRPGRGGDADSEYLIESLLGDDAFHPAHVKGMYPDTPDKWVGDIGILKPRLELRDPSNFNLYKRSWWSGYKPIKQLGGSLPTYQTQGEVSFQSLDPRLQGSNTDATYVDQGIINDPYILNRNQAQIIADESPQQTVSSYEKPSVVDQAINKLANPFTTAGYLARGEMMPTTVPSKDNVFDMAADIVNPVAYIDYAKQAIGDYGDGDVVGGTFNAMAAAPFIPGNIKGLFGKGSSLRKTVISPYSAKLDKTLYAPQKVYGRGMPNMDAEMTMRGELIEQYNARNNAYHTVNITDDIRNNEYLRNRARTYGYNPDSDRDLALFLGTSPGGVGRRTGYENILPEGFDFLYSGNNPIQTFSRYSQFGDNVAPFTTKFKLFNDNPSMLSDRQLFERIQALDGVNTYRPDLGIKTLKKSEDLSGMVQGQIINTNSLHVPGLNQTNIMVGRKNIPVRDPIDIRSAREMSGWPSAFELGDGRGQFKNPADYDFYFKQTGGQQGPPYMTEGPVQELVYPGRQEGPQDVLTENISRTGKLGNATKPAPPSVDVDRLRKGIKYAESLGGKLMMNPESSATGFYGQLFSEIEGKDFLQGISRQQFANDTTLQNKVFDERLAGNEGLFGKKTGLVQDGLDLYNEYKPQLGDKLTYTPTEIAALTNMLGRQGTREYLGYVLRDGKSLEEALPNLYGSSAKYKNKTPDQYIQKFNKAFGEGGENIPVYNTYSSKNRAWLAARKNLGRGKKFMYGGKVYSTNTPKGL